mmetsp:Transcript_16976/g.34956  ORF Transcript_16976/g.34956 Transcript_16976/m.34956 type:complete len:928 (-) Transcript_16976:16-2799(-)
MESTPGHESQTPPPPSSTDGLPSTSPTSKNLKQKVVSAKNALEDAGMLPKIHPVPWSTFFVLLVFVSVPPVAFTFAFSSMGKGEEYIAAHDTERESRASAMKMGIGGSLLVLYLSDFTYWKSSFAKSVRAFVLCCVVVMMTIWLLASARTMPSGLILIFSLGTVLWFVSMKHIFYYDVIFRDYVAWIVGPMFAASVTLLVVWVIWISSDVENAWNVETKVRYAKVFDWDMQLMEQDFIDKNMKSCMANATNASSFPTCIPDVPTNNTYFTDDCPAFCADMYNGCQVAFLVWSTPFIVSLVMLFLSFMCAFLNPQSSGSAPTTFGKVFMMLLFGLWCTASLSGAGSGITSYFASFMFGAMLSISVLMVSTFGVPANADELNKLEAFKNLKKRYGWMADFMKATLVAVCSPMVAGYLCLAFLNQMIRRSGILPCSVKLDRSKGEHKLWVTRNAMAQIVEFKRWDHAKVYNWAIIMGAVYILVNVAAMKFTVLFLSWMKQQCVKMKIMEVTGIIAAVGMTLFLLPPVPGVPIYLTGGLMIPVVATGIGEPPEYNDDGTKRQDQFAGWDLMSAIVYTCFVSLIIKLCACTLQQKVIGEPLSHKVWIRQLVGVNSDTIRTMKLVLKQPGLNIAKVAILVGGPDWPTSVFCGIMRLPLHQILFGTLPVFLLIIPTCLSGTFLWMSLVMDPETRQPTYPWASTVSTIFLLGSGMVQTGSMVVAAFHLEQAVRTRGDELAEIPIDQEVLEADNRDKSRGLLYVKLTQWHRVPYFWKKMLHLGVFFQIVSCYITVMMTYSATYGLTNKPEDLPDGKWYNLLNMKGWASMLCFALSLVCWYLFRAWAFKQVDEYEKSGKPMPTEGDVQEEMIEAGLSISQIAPAPENDDGKERASEVPDHEGAKMEDVKRDEKGGADARIVEVKGVESGIDGGEGET